MAGDQPLPREAADLQHRLDAAKVAGGIAAGNQKLLAEIIWPHFWAIQIIVLVVIFNYCVIRELGRVLGEDRIFRIFIRRDFPVVRAPDR